MSRALQQDRPHRGSGLLCLRLVGRSASHDRRL